VKPKKKGTKKKNRDKKRPRNVSMHDIDLSAGKNQVQNDVVIIDVNSAHE
jgi:hypothetical protein